MSIGVIIFIISVIVTIISAVNDKSHEKRKQTPPPPSQSNQPKSFMEKFEKTLKEMETELDKEFDEVPKAPKEKTTQPKPIQHDIPRSPTETQQTPEVAPKRAQNSRKDQQEVQKELWETLQGDITSLDEQLNRERQKQISHIERRAKSIIEDQYLSPRAKRIKLKQLLANSTKRQQMKGDLTFSDNEVVNGIIWAEVIDKRKQLN
ncbi:hypothetical protein [Staphylococcus chromogenes]|uniref:hypothetical protein n=1 Tax=Staphylococcus chromogenes TaxID=46126 RepID=UPI000D1BF375|nr:hypothetical protein [Staphylococcus chromogenes]PTG10355.1 hypothetical protein BU648_00185 [Staphylococcus chromogenes]